MRNGCTGTRAHTLLEVIIVMLIVSTVLAIAVPELGKKLAVVRLDALAGQMAADIRTVQQMAINEESAAYFIEFYPYGERYEIRKTSHPMYIVLDKVTLPDTADLVATNFSGDRLAFSTQGSPVQGGTVTLQDKRSGRFRYVIVTPITGRVRVSDSPPESWKK